MEQNILIAVGVFSIICVICVAAIGLSMVKQNEKLKEKIRNEKKPMYNVWLSALSNNLPMLLDGKDLYSINTEIKSFKLTDLKPTEKDVALAVQKQQFEAKEKIYVEKIRQLEKILADEEIKVSACGQVTNLKADKLKYEKYELNLEKSGIQKEVERIIEDTEKRRTEAYDLIANVYKFEQTIMPEYGRYKAGDIDISELGKELESTFREYFRREKIIKEESK